VSILFFCYSITILALTWCRMLRQTIYGY
jgi:hypothetical protein